MKIDLILKKGFKVPVLITVDLTFDAGKPKKGKWVISAGEARFRLIATVKEGSFAIGWQRSSGQEALFCYNDSADHNPLSGRFDPFSAFALVPAPSGWIDNGVVAILNPLNELTKNYDPNQNVVPSKDDAEYRVWK